MAALLVGIAIMGVLLATAMPSWRTLVRREKEEELIFRGEQYARAVGLYQRKFAAAYPPSVDVLIQQKFLRKRYTDPMTKGEKGGEGGFVILYQNSRQVQPGVPGGTNLPGAEGLGAQAGSSSLRAGQAAAQPPSRQTGAFGGSVGIAGGLSQPVDTTASAGFGSQLAGIQGGIVGVASRSKEKSLRLYNGRSVYEQWQFVWNAGGGPGGGRGPVRPGQQAPGRGFGRGGQTGRPGSGSQPSVPPTLPSTRRSF